MPKPAPQPSPKPPKPAPKPTPKPQPPKRVEIPQLALFETPTAAELARRVQQALEGGSGVPALPPIERGFGRSPSDRGTALADLGVVVANERFHRVLLKLSGEAMVGESAFGIDPMVVDRLALQIGEPAGFVDARERSEDLGRNLLVEC